MRAAKIRIRIAASVIVLLFVLAPVASVYANYVDNFDTYLPNIQNPGPWQFSATNPSCWSSRTTQIGSLAETPPGIYDIIYNAGSCNTTPQHSTFYIIVNATASPLNFTYWWKSSASGGTGTVQVYINGTSLEGPDAIPLLTTWHEVSKTSSVSASSIYVLNFSVVASTSSAAFSIFIDTALIKGADSYVHGANLFLEQYSYTGTKAFNITDFYSSKIIINYTSGPAYVADNITAPSLSVPLAGANLITVYVGEHCTPFPPAINPFSTCTTPSYYRSVIPTSTVHQVVYLDNPLVVPVYQYQMQVLDFSNQFPAGSIIQLFLATASTATNPVTSGYLDSNHYFDTGLIPGRYSLQLQHDSNFYNSSITLTPSILNTQITVPSIKISFQANQQTSIACGGYWNEDQTAIIGYYRDSTLTTTTVALTLTIDNASGTYTINNDVFGTGPYGNITDTFSSIPDLNQSSSYYMTCGITDVFGTYLYPGVGGQVVVGGRAGNSMVNIPDVLHIGAFLPKLASPTGQISGLGMLTVIAGSFSEFFGPIGLVITAFFSAYLINAGWILINPDVGIVFILFAIVGLLIYLERKNR